MKKSTEIIGLPVVSINEAKELGSIKELLINPTEGNVAAIVLDDGQWYYGAKLIPFNEIAGIGEYAATVKHSNVITPMAAAPELEALLVANVKIIGTKVLTSSGRIIGTVTEIFVDMTGKISNCEVTEQNGNLLDIPAQKIYTFGKEVLVVADENDVSTLQITVPAEIKQPIIEENPQLVNTPEENIAPEQILEKDDDDSAKKFDDKHRKYLLGKKANRRIETDNGVLIVDNGGEITEEVLQKAKLAGKFVELSMSVQ